VALFSLWSRFCRWVPLIFLPVTCEHAIRPFLTLVFGFPLATQSRAVLSPWVRPVRSPLPAHTSQVPSPGRALLGMPPYFGSGVACLSTAAVFTAYCFSSVPWRLVFDFPSTVAAARSGIRFVAAICMRKSVLFLSCQIKGLNFSSFSSFFYGVFLIMHIRCSIEYARDREKGC
jgi:hypothetical protein